MGNSVGSKRAIIHFQMALKVGSKLGPYEIVAPLGAGGMGAEVTTVSSTAGFFREHADRGYRGRNDSFFLAGWRVAGIRHGR